MTIPGTRSKTDEFSSDHCEIRGFDRERMMRKAVRLRATRGMETKNCRGELMKIAMAGNGRMFGVE
jgi:hypothetical protein